MLKNWKIYQMKKVKKTTRVRRKRGKSKSRMYFGPEIHDSIVEYQKLENEKEKEKTYVESIRPAFDKLSENLIFIHGFAKNHDSYETLKSDCVTFLYETLSKFDSTRGTKAFSYFNVVAKNWLIIQSKKASKSLRRDIRIDDYHHLNARDKYAIESYKIEPSQDEIMMKNQSTDEISKLMIEIKRKVSNPNEVACIDAIITLFKKIEDLDFLNKRAVFIYMRDISNLSPKQLSIAMSTIRKHYKDLRKNGDYDIFFGGWDV